MRESDAEPKNNPGSFVPFVTRLAHTLRAPDAFPSLVMYRIALLPHPQLHSNNTRNNDISGAGLVFFGYH